MVAAIEVRSDMTMTSVSDDSRLSSRQQRERGLGARREIDEQRVERLVPDQLERLGDRRDRDGAVGARIRLDARACRAKS